MGKICVGVAVVRRYGCFFCRTEPAEKRSCMLIAVLLLSPPSFRRCWCYHQQHCVFFYQSQKEALTLCASVKISVIIAIASAVKISVRTISSFLFWTLLPAY